MMKKRGIIVAFLAALLLMPGPASARHEEEDANFPNPLLLPGPPPVRSWIDLNTKEIGGPFTLIDQDGKNVTEKDYEKYYKLILFGYTNSRTQSPATLRKLVKSLEPLGDDADKIRILFFTTDPARDTPEVMKKFLEKFWSNKIVGLTGTIENVAHTENKFRIYAEKVTDPRFGGYTVNHSSVIYFTAPDGKFLTVFNPADSPPIIFGKIRQKMKDPG